MAVDLEFNELFTFKAFLIRKCFSDLLPPQSSVRRDNDQVRIVITCPCVENTPVVSASASSVQHETCQIHQICPSLRSVPASSLQST